MAEGGNSNKLLVTPRHIVLPLNKTLNDKFDRKNESTIWWQVTW